MKLFLAVAVAALMSGTALAAEPAPAAPITAHPPSADAAPAAVVEMLYAGYFRALSATDAGGPSVGWIEYSKAYLAPDLAARIAKTQSPDADPLDVDFLIVAQDYQNLILTKLVTTAVDTTTATVRVSFSNMDSPTVSDVMLVKLPEGWRISDIVASPGTPDQFSLTGVLKDMGL